MRSFQKKSCKLCLNNVTDVNFKIIDKTIKQVLLVLLIKLNVEERNRSVICAACSAKLFDAFKFKAACMDTEDMIFPYVNSKNQELVDLKDVYLIEKGKDRLRSVLEDERICRLCMQIVTCGFTLLSEVEFDMIINYIPEVNFNSTKEPVICEVCLGLLKTHSRFLITCFEVGNKIKSTCSEQIVESLFHILTDEITIKSEESDDICDTLLRNSDGEFLDCEEQFDTEDAKTIKTNILLEFKEEQLVPEHKNEIEKNTYNSDVVSPSNNFESILKSSAVEYQLHKNPEKRKYNCDTCGYTTIIKCNFISHQKTHLPRMYKCDICSFDTYDGSLLTRHHELNHTYPSKVQMYKCDTCSYQTKRSCHLRRHQQIHKALSEVKTYQCDACDFTTRYKTSIIDHQLVHKDNSQVQRYRCGTCGYELKHKSSLILHQRIHRDSSEVAMYKCDTCDFQTRYKGSLKSHKERHKAPPKEKIVYECDVCDFTTKHRFHFTRHQLRHKNPPAVPTYKCDACNHVTKNRSRLARHQLKHKDPSEVRMYQCEVCDFTTKHKSSFNSHVLTHKDRSEVVMYKCGKCDYESRFKKNLVLHQRKHVNSSEGLTLKCGKCNFRSKYIANVKAHEQKHKAASKKLMYKCDKCDFESKYLVSVNYHKQTNRCKANLQGTSWYSK